LVALQTPYNLLNRSAEGDLLAMAHDLGLGVLPTTPLTSGALAIQTPHAKSMRPGTKSKLSRRWGQSPRETHDGHRGAIVSALHGIAAEVERSPTQVALAWTLLNPAVISPVVTPRTSAQLDEHCAALEITLSADQIERLDVASRPKPES